MPLRPERFGDLPQGLTDNHRDFLRKVKDALEILTGVKRSQLDTAKVPGNQAVVFDDHLTNTPVYTVSEYADNAAALAGGLAIGKLYRTGDALKVVH